MLLTMAVAEVLADDRTMFGLDPSIIVGVSRPGCGQFDQECLEQLDHVPVDVPGTVVGVTTGNNKRELIQ